MHFLQNVFNVSICLHAEVLSKNIPRKGGTFPALSHRRYFKHRGTLLTGLVDNLACVGREMLYNQVVLPRRKELTQEAGGKGTGRGGGGENPVSAMPTQNQDGSLARLSRGWVSGEGIKRWGGK